MRFVFLFLIIPLLSPGQNLKLNFPPNFNGAEVLIIGFRGMEQKTLDSSNVKDGLYQTSGLNWYGESSIILNGQELTRFISSRSEKPIGTVVIQGGALGVVWEDSPQNEAYRELSILENQLELRVEGISNSMDGIDEFDSRRNTKLDSLEVVYETAVAVHNDRTVKFRRDFQDTYAADVLAGLVTLPQRSDKQEWAAKYDNNKAFLHRHFFHNMDLTDERILFNPRIKNKLLDYLYNYTGREEEELKVGVDQILLASNISETVKMGFAEILIGFFSSKQLYEYVEYINQEYLSTCAGDVSPAVQAVLNEVSPLLVGDEMPSFVLQDSFGDEADLTYSDKKRVIMFWASWCEHCEAQLPRMADFLRGYEDELELVAFGLDSVEAVWRKYVEAFPDPILHYSDLESWNSPLIKDLGITSTPTFVLIGPNRKYLGRAATLLSLDKLIQKQGQ